MPEGDTIRRVAARLGPVLAGQALVRLDLPRLPRQDRRRPPLGSPIESVEARGKHLLIAFESGITLRTHMGMTGAWHLYRPDERWHRPRFQLRALVGVDGWDALCFDAPVVELERRSPLAHLGPDLCAPDPDLDECLSRMDRVADLGAEVADVLRDQRVACGVGNVYASEVCFANRVHPRTPLQHIDVGVRRALIETASRLLRANLGGGPRTTMSGPPGTLAVYGRANRPCRRCSTPIEVARSGRFARASYWCPSCQPPAWGPTA
jgi:endonuclease VIII